MERGGIDIVLGLQPTGYRVTWAHSAQIAENSANHDAELWIAKADARISDIKMRIGAVLGQEMVENKDARHQGRHADDSAKGKALGGRAWLPCEAGI